MTVLADWRGFCDEGLRDLTVHTSRTQPLAAMIGVFLLGCGAVGVDDSGESAATNPLTAPTSGVCETTPMLLDLDETDGIGLEDGGTLTLVHGPQGGWHVSIDATVQGRRDLLFRGALTVLATGEAVAGEGGENRITLADWSEDDCTGQQTLFSHINDAAVVNQDYICELVGQELLFAFEVADPDGGSDSNSVVLVAKAWSGDPC